MAVVRRRRVAAWASPVLFFAAAGAAPASQPATQPVRRPASPFDRHDDRDDLDAAVTPLAELNLRPGFRLSDEQKQQVQSIRDAFDDRRAAWESAHAAELQQLGHQWQALWRGGGGHRPSQDQIRALDRQSAALRVDAPDPTDAMEQVRGVLTAEQQRQLDAWVNRDPDAHGQPPTGFGAEVLPLPADGRPVQPGFYKLRMTASVPTAGGRPRAIRMTYVLFLPKSYRPDGGPYPTLMFLHGSGEVGTDGNALFARGLGPAAAIHARAGSAFADDFPMILVCPQCPPRGERWDQEPVVRAALAVLDEAATKVRIDPDRVYATGLSMGGKGTWLMTSLAPDRFAGIVPISADTLDLPLARRVAGVPVWTINGADDDDGPGNEAQMVAAARAAGDNAEATSLPGEGHGVWQQFYDDPAFYQWFLQRRRPSLADPPRRLAATRPATVPTAR